jgi:hypothetical protein
VSSTNRELDGSVNAPAFTVTNLARGPQEGLGDL